MPVALETERLILDARQSSDWTAFRPIATNPQLMRYISGGVPWSGARSARANDFHRGAGEYGLQAHHGETGAPNRIQIRFRWSAIGPPRNRSRAVHDAFRSELAINEFPRPLLHFHRARFSN